MAERLVSSIATYPGGAARRKLIELMFLCHVYCRASMSRLCMLSRSHTAADFFPTEQMLTVLMASPRLVAVDNRSLSSMLPHNAMLIKELPADGEILLLLSCDVMTRQPRDTVVICHWMRRQARRPRLRRIDISSRDYENS